MRFPFVGTTLTLALLLSGCGAVHAERSVPASATAKTPGNAWTALPRDGDRLAVSESKPLPGAGAVAFHPSRALLVWADGSKVQILDLSSGESHAIQVGTTVSDLGFSPQGDLWAIAGQATLWRGDAAVCRSSETDMDRLLGIDAEGMTAAGYTYSDGVGPIRHQLWLDNNCRLHHESRAPLPANVRDADVDAGESPLRASLRSPRAFPAGGSWTVDNNRLRSDREAALILPSSPVAVSADGRWWVFGEPGRRALWRLAEPK